MSCFLEDVIVTRAVRGEFAMKIYPVSLGTDTLLYPDL